MNSSAMYIDYVGSNCAEHSKFWVLATAKTNYSSNSGHENSFRSRLYNQLNPDIIVLNISTS